MENKDVLVHEYTTLKLLKPRWSLQRARWSTLSGLPKLHLIRHQAYDTGHNWHFGKTGTIGILLFSGGKEEPLRRLRSGAVEEEGFVQFIIIVGCRQNIYPTFFQQFPSKFSTLLSIAREGGKSPPKKCLTACQYSYYFPSNLGAQCQHLPKNSRLHLILYNIFLLYIVIISDHHNQMSNIQGGDHSGMVQSEKGNRQKSSGL